MFRKPIYVTGYPVDTRKFNKTGDNAYKIDTTSYVSVKARCVALEQSTENLASFRASRYGREIQSEIDANGVEHFDNESLQAIQNDRFDSTDAIYVDKIDSIDKVQAKAEEIDSVINDTVNAHLEAEKRIILDVAEKKRLQSENKAPTSDAK